MDYYERYDMGKRSKKFNINIIFILFSFYSIPLLFSPILFYCILPLRNGKIITL